MSINFKLFLIVLALTMVTVSLGLAIYDLKYAVGLAINIFLILKVLQTEKDKHDDEIAHDKWDVFIGKKWDNYGIAWLGAIVLITLQSYAFVVLSEYYKWDYNFLYDKAGQYIIAAFLGWSSDIVVDKLYQKRKTIIDKLDAKL